MRPANSKARIVRRKSIEKYHLDRMFEWFKRKKFFNTVESVIHEELESKMEFTYNPEQLNIVAWRHFCIIGHDH